MAHRGNGRTILFTIFHTLTSFSQPYFTKFNHRLHTTASTLCKKRCVLVAFTSDTKVPSNFETMCFSFADSNETNYGSRSLSYPHVVTGHYRRNGLPSDPAIVMSTSYTRGRPRNNNRRTVRHTVHTTGTIL